ncbi:MAG TPA: NAD-dependent epimerase/dehydratase family protein [Thermoleophilaceae bacterium]|nr:NAD-dependent epimerase/dehydratase family protein [Thermoleophilaceae bacterium]
MRCVITGGSGYIGSRLVDHLSRRQDVERIVICDLQPPRGYKPKTEFQRLDVRDRDAVRRVLERAHADALVHLAFIFNPVHDEHLMYDVDVGGTQSVLEAASLAGTQQVLVATSAAAYGAFPDNPEPITEEHPVRGVASFSYARDKTEADRLCQLWALEHPERTMTIVRPSIVFGPNVDNYLVRLWTAAPFQPDVGNLDNRIQFVHEDDVVEGIIGLLHGRQAGAYNVAGDGLMTLRECAELAGNPIRRMPLGAYRLLGRIFWALHVAEAPPGQLEFAIHPWVVSADKLKGTGWKPRHTSRETFEITMRAHGKLPPGGPAPPTITGTGEPEPVATLAAEAPQGR